MSRTVAGSSGFPGLIADVRTNPEAILISPKHGPIWSLDRDELDGEQTLGGSSR